MKKLILSGCFLLVGLICSYFLVSVPIMVWIDYPMPYLAELPEFKGRILPSDVVRPGTFTVETDFESVSNWGQEGILSYELRYGSRVVLKAWRPDEKTSGVFQYAEKTVEKPEGWRHFNLDKIEKEGNYLKLYPSLGAEVVMVIILGSFFSIYFIYAGVHIITVSFWRRKENLYIAGGD